MGEQISSDQLGDIVYKMIMNTNIAPSDAKTFHPLRVDPI